MILQDPLFTAVVVLTAAVLVGLLAYAFVHFLRVRRDSAKPLSDQEPPLTESQITHDPDSKRDRSAEPADLKAIKHAADPEVRETSDVFHPNAHPIPTATLLHDKQTGAIIVRVGDREYHCAASLKQSEDWKDIEAALTELIHWFSEAADQEILQDLVKQPTPDEVSAKPKTLMEQINEVLERKAAERKGALRDVRLIEGPEGNVQVVMGLESYALDEVPNAEVRRIIREAVEAWEAQQ